MRPRTLAALAAAGLAIAAPAALAAQPTTLGTGAKTCTLQPGADCSRVVHKWTTEFHGDAHRAKFMKADLRGADFRGADLHGADFRGAQLRHVDFRDANLRGARFGVPRPPGQGSRQTSVCPSGTGALGPAASCKGADLSGGNFSRAFAIGGDFQNANVTGASFVEAQMDLARFMSANATGANFRAAELNGALFNYANLTGADLQGILAQETDMNPMGIVFIRANLTNANLSRAWIHPEFSFANLTGANLTGTNIIDADWDTTTCPNGTVTSSGC
jgi:uncharacterized protein YjbI with pentapeptide repeats